MMEQHKIIWSVIFMCLQLYCVTVTQSVILQRLTQ